jgi:hypothetical protein
MENWLGILTLIFCLAIVNLGVAFVVFRGLATWLGFPGGFDTSAKVLTTLLITIPVAGVAGVPFFIVPFIGPLFGTFVSACVASMLVARDYSVTQRAAAKAIVPTVVLLYAVSGTMLYFGIPML